MLSSKLTRGSVRHDEFVAHSASVSCLSFGLKSGRVFATGGEDKKVNLWAVGKSSCILSLSGHTTSVECVKFSHGEDLICAGSQSGALKIWDLEASKILRTLTGHRASVRSLDFHPYGDFLASGSLDTNIKLWDIRKKGCMYTYKGHSKDVYCLRFSPDGRWLASGGDEGAVKIWDLPAGKMLAELKVHNAPITDVNFHPNEFLLSSSSADGTVKFWDLETFQQVSTTSNDTGPIAKVAYHPDGKVLFSAARDVLKVYQWEPARTLDTLFMGWGKVKDMSATEMQLIAGATSLTNVSIYVVDLKSVKPFAHDSQCSKPAYVRDSPSRQSARRAFVPGQCSASHLQLESLESNKSETETATSDDAGEELSLVEIKNPGDFRTIFQPKRELNRTPPPPDSISPFALPQTSASSFDLRKLSDSNLTSLTSFPTKSTSTSTLSAGSNRLVSGMRSVEYLAPILPAHLDLLIPSPSTPLLPGPNPLSRQATPSKIDTLPVIAPINGQSIKQPTIGNAYQFSRSDTNLGYKVTISTSHFPPPSLPSSRSNKNPSPIKPTVPDSQVSFVRPVVSDTKKPSNGLSKDLFEPKQAAHPKAAVAPMPSTARVSAQRSAVVFPEQHSRNQQPPMGLDAHVELIPEARDQPAGLDIDEFLPKHLQDTMRLGYIPQPEMSESEAMQAIIRGHKSLVTALSHRKKNIQIVLAMWSTKDPRNALEQAFTMDDQSVIVDILNIITLKPSVWTLDMCQQLLPCIHELLQSKYECYMSVGCGALKLILKNFAAMIKTNITAPPGVGVDISREERYNKCMSCYNQLLSVRAFILKRQTLQGKLGRSFRELSILMQSLE
ncbi:Katanin p80 WD40 repeat-containing subunit B1 [Halotydeus destructor]|nr:Katanin p80 WD40 repeat-containing subunit B1 [Halotydeus destructor]